MFPNCFFTTGFFICNLSIIYWILIPTEKSYLVVDQLLSFLFLFDFIGFWSLFLKLMKPWLFLFKKKIYLFFREKASEWEMGRERKTENPFNEVGRFPTVST